jgi:hypothetical protein
MALSSRQKNKFLDSMNLEIDRIINWRMPKSSKNNESAAWKLFIAQFLASRANKAKELAEIEAVKAGVLFDKVKNPMAEGTKDFIYNGEIIRVLCEVRKAAYRIDSKKLLDYLASAGVNTALLDQAAEAAGDFSRPAHVFTTYIVTEEANGK